MAPAPKTAKDIRYIPTLGMRIEWPSTTIATTSATAASAASATTTTTPIKGQNVSGRPWKSAPQKRASSLVKTSFNNQSSSWDRKLHLKRDRQEAVALQAELKEQKRQAILAKKQRRLDNETRRAENEYKALKYSVQQLNTEKLSTTLKTMSKKQLRQVKKTRVNAKTGVVEFVPAYSK
jgi:rRNA-processing protein CGR1